MAFSAKNIVTRTKNERGYLVLKRIFDFIAALIGIILLSPIFLIISILIRRDSKGPIVFGHVRKGLHGRDIKVYKFRTMYENSKEIFENFTEEQKREFYINFKLDNDPRITKIGEFLRKTSLDELPQLFNILKGDMTIVGPRPIVIDELEFYGECEDYYKAVKPGLTGLWQVSGRSDTTYDERVNLDMEYVTTRNTFKDLYIIFMTAVKVLKREGSY